MNRPEEDLLARYLEGDLAPGEEAALLDLLRRDPKAAERLESFLRLDEGLREALVPEASGDALARAVAERLAKHGGTGVFARQVVEQIAAAERSERKKTRWIRILRPRDRSSGAWTLPLVAAAALFAILILAAVASQPKGRPSRPQDPVVVQVEPIPEPDPPMPPPKKKSPGSDPVRPIPEKKDDPLPKPEPAPLREVVPAKPEEPRIPAPEVPKPPAPPGTIAKPPVPEPPARIERADGEVFLASKEGVTPVRAPQDLSAGWDLQTTDGSVVVVLSDKTRLELAGRTQVRDERPTRGQRGKRFFVAEGTLDAQVTAQPVGHPLVFATPSADATVLGTRLRLDVRSTSTVLEVTEGKVRLTRTRDGRSVDVPAGSFAEAAPGVPLEVRAPQGIDEIVLGSPRGRIENPKGQIPDWVLVQDGRVFDAPKVRNGADPESRTLFKMHKLGFVEFAFRADADKEYTVWVRGARGRKGDTDPPGNEWYRFDLLALEIPETVCVSGQGLTVEGRAYQFNGYGQKEGFWWISGNADPSNSPNMTGQPTDAPVRIRFLRRGLQVLRVYPVEGPMRFDAIWLSATQKQRPPESQIGAQKK